MDKTIIKFIEDIASWYQVSYEGYGDKRFNIPVEDLQSLWSSSKNIKTFIKDVNETYLIDRGELVELWEEAEQKAEKTPVKKAVPRRSPVGGSSSAEPKSTRAEPKPLSAKATLKKFSQMLEPEEYTNSVITITFGDQAENHVGMEKIGEAADHGFSIEALEKSQNKLEKAGFDCELIRLNTPLEELDIEAPEAAVLVIRNGVNMLLQDVDADDEDLFKELVSFPWDTKAKMYGRVVDKHARHNVCFYEEAQEPDYENGKGRIVAYDDVPLLSHIRSNLPRLLGRDAKDLAGEGNFYYDTSVCGIGFHGDSERRKVVALRVGQNSTPMNYQWFHEGSPVGERIIIPLNVGDVYVMSEKAVGTDWKSKKIYTLRHATGCKKFTTIA